jgi:prepilin-type N-terminal cleavage/methylation domain-containing protein
MRGFFNKQGFTLIELMIVVAIVAFLSMVSVPSFMRYMAKAKRTEAYMNLGAIYTAEKMHWAEHGCYTEQLCGTNGAGWKPENYSGGGSKERFYYTYGFAQGKEGEHYFTGKLGASIKALPNAKADQSGFLAIAAADIDGDGKLDVIGINDKHEIVILQDDLAD